MERDSIERQKPIGARHEIVEEGQTGENREVVGRNVAALRAIRAGEQMQPASLEGLELPVGDPGNGVINAIEVDLHALGECRLGQADAMAKRGLVRSGGEEQAKLLSAKRHKSSGAENGAVRHPSNRSYLGRRGGGFLQHA